MEGASGKKTIHSTCVCMSITQEVGNAMRDILYQYNTWKMGRTRNWAMLSYQGWPPEDWKGFLWPFHPVHFLFQTPGLSWKELHPSVLVDMVLVS